MKVIIVTSSISRSSGGVGPVVKQLAKCQQELSCEISLCCWLEDDTFKDMPKNRQFKVIAEPTSKFSLPGGSRRLNERLARIIPGTDIVHCHALWESCLWSTAAIARKCRKPYVVTPHGMLEPWSLQQSKIKKSIVRQLFVNSYLFRAACLHATADQEAQSIRNLGFRNPVAVIPIGLDMTEYCMPGDSRVIEESWPELTGKKIMLFMSRVHPKKGLFNLAKVWGKLARKYSDWHLVIAGPDGNGHEAEVKAAIEKVGAAKQTTFTGPVYGELKKQLYAASDFFVLPTFSENFGIVIAEALASGKPVITTKGTPWHELRTQKCGWWIDIGHEPLEVAMKEAMELSDQQRQGMGLRGKRLINENYTWPKIAADMINVYKWVLGQGDKPDCVRL